MTTPQLTKPILRSDDSANMNGLDKGRLDIQLSNIDLLSKQLREGKFDSFRETISNIPPELLDIDLPDRHGRYLIFMACSLNHIPTVKILMEHNCTLSVHQLNKTVLEVVLQSGYHELLDLLLKYDKKTLGHSVVNIVGENAPLGWLTFDQLSEEQREGPLTGVKDKKVALRSAKAESQESFVSFLREDPEDNSPLYCGEWFLSPNG